MGEELARRVKEGAIPIISDVRFQAYSVIYAPDDTVAADFSRVRADSMRRASAEIAVQVRSSLAAKPPGGSDRATSAAMR